MDWELMKGMTPEQLKEYRKKRNAERNKIYRELKGTDINEAKREKRKADKAIEKIKPEIVTPNLKKAKKLPVISTAIKTNATKKNYILFIKRFYKKITNNELADDADIIKKINEQPYKSLMISKQFKPIINENIKEIIKIPNEVNNLYVILRGIRGFTDIVKILHPYLYEYHEQYQDNRSQIIASEDDLNKINFNNIPEYEANLQKLDNITDKIIYSYIMIIRGRVGDLRMTKIAENKKDTESNEYNWLYQNKLYINNTKNKKKNIIELPAVLNFWNSVKGEYILGRIIPSSTYSQQIQRIFLKIYDKVYTATDIRHLYATYINNKGSSLKERQATAKQSGHSVMEQLSYVYKVDKNLYTDD